MSKMLPILVVIVFSVVCLGMALLMPWAELGFPASLPQLMQLREALMAKLPGGSDPQVFVYYVYSLFLAAAMVSASVGLWLEGREESEEKTLLPVKK
jgi:hypothetical protein